jgi:hypothetical protein
MKTPRTFHQTVAVHTIALLVLAGCTLLVGCATDSSMLGSGTNITASDKTRMTRSGYLSDYTRLKPTPWSDGIECWRDPGLDARNYDKVLISRIVVSLVPPKDKDSEQLIDPSDLKTLTDYFHGSLSQGAEAKDAGR